MMATLVAEPIDRPDWVFEPKFDGLRVLTYFDGQTAHLISRNDKPQEGMFPDVAAALEKSLRKPAVVDGESVCFDDGGERASGPSAALPPQECHRHRGPRRKISGLHLPL